MTSVGTAATRVLGAVLGIVLELCVPAAAQMPDPSLMNGRSLPAPDAAVGTTTVRVMKERIGNNVVGQDVSLVDGAGATIATRKTDDGGRATFDALRAGVTYHAVAVVAGERLESLPFTQPSDGGLRVVLIAGLAGRGAGTPPGSAAAAAAPPVAARPAPPGSIVLGTQSRLVVEQADEFVEVFVLVDLVNTTDGPVSLPTPIVFTLPADALGSAVLEGSTDVAALDAGRIVVKGPLTAGPNLVQFGYRLPSDGGSVTIRQALPVAGPLSTVIVRRTGATAVVVAGERSRRDTALEGRQYIVVTSGAVKPGVPLDVAISGLPARPRWPVRVALSLAAGIVLLGLAFGRARADDDAAAPLPARS
jgi:hypothetical protein